MENRLNETGNDFGKITYLSKSRNNEFKINSVCRKEHTDRIQKISWSNPEASKRLINQLLQCVNYKEEYQLLERDLAELEQLFPSSSELIERRFCLYCS